MVISIVEEKRNIIDELLNNSFIADYIGENTTITDINYDGVKMLIQDNIKGQFYPEKQPTINDVGRFINQIANVQGKQFNNSQPILDTDVGFLRVNAVHQSLSPDGMTFSIRVSKPRLASSGVAEMVESKDMDVENLLDVLVQAKSNLIISGETGSGKTEFQKTLVKYIPDDMPIVLIEDTYESHIKELYPEKHIKSWVVSSDSERESPITIETHVKSGLRNFPKFILVAEVRGVEAASMLDSTKTNHAIITTIHSTNAMNTPSRLMSMIRQSPSYSQMNDILLGKEVAEFLRFGIHLEAVVTEDGIKRKIKEIVEYTDFNENGVVGTYLYKLSNEYNSKTETYEVVEKYGQLSGKTISHIQDKKLYHMIPEKFKPIRAGGFQ